MHSKPMHFNFPIFYSIHLYLSTIQFVLITACLNLELCLTVVYKPAFETKIEVCGGQTNIKGGFRGSGETVGLFTIK